MTSDPMLPPRVLVICGTADKDRPTVTPARLSGRVYYCAACGATDHDPYTEDDREHIAAAAAT